MKKILKVENFLDLIGILTIIGFIIRLGADYYKIQTGVNSAPFVLFVIERSFEFIVPGIACFVVATVLRRRSRKI